MIKSMGAGGILLGGLYLAGAFDPGYSRVVGRPPAQVAEAIADLDIRNAPGEPTLDPAQSGGVRPVIQVERFADRVTWTVMSGDKMAVRMTATLEPLENGTQTRVRTEVERGNAPDDFVAPAFRSKGLTLGLFSMAVEGELDKLTIGTSWGPHCQAIVERVKEEGTARAMAESDMPPESGMGAAVGRVAKMGLQLNAIESELRRAGCNTDGNRGEFRQVESRMAPSDPSHEAHPDVSFKPGQPMVDLREGR